ncbi:hypothetical protein, partial [Thiolapillus sp.]|uniref:hypothetical protein n=1 Tax=Thiolapillus sp. TaxID=2017437 RepID=UPI003AF908A0
EDTTETVIRESFVIEKPDMRETFTEEIAVSPKPPTEVFEKEHFKEEITISPEKPSDADEIAVVLEMPKEDVPMEEEDLEARKDEQFKEEIIVSPEKPTETGEVIFEVDMPQKDAPEIFEVEHFKEEITVLSEEEPEVSEEEHFKEEITVSPEKPIDVGEVALEVQMPKEDVPVEEEDRKETEETVAYKPGKEIPESVAEEVDVVTEEIPEVAPQEASRPEDTTETVIRESFVIEKPDMRETFTEEIAVSPKPPTEVFEKEHFKEEITISPEKPSDADEIAVVLEMPKEDVPM